MSYTTADALALTGATRRQAYYWAEQGWLRPEVTGTPGTRQSTYTWPCPELRVMGALVDAGTMSVRPRGTSLALIAAQVRAVPQGRFWILEQDTGDAYAVTSDQALIGLILDVDGMVAVNLIRSLADMTGVPT